MPETDEDKSSKKKFNVYPISFFYTDTAEVQAREGKLQLFAAVDRTSKFAFARLEKSVNIYTAATFLLARIEVLTYKTHTVLTDNGIKFCYLPSRHNSPIARLCTYMFDHKCRKIASNIG